MSGHADPQIAAARDFQPQELFHQHHIFYDSHSNSEMIDDRPLLSGNDISNEAPSQEPPAIPRRTPTNPAIVAVLGLVLLVNFSTSLYQLPVSRVIERRLCREYFAKHDPSVIGPDGSVSEGLCKLPDVQSGLARIQGLMETAWIVGGENRTSRHLSRSVPELTGCRFCDDHPPWLCRGAIRPEVNPLAQSCPSHFHARMGRCRGLFRSRAAN